MVDSKQTWTQMRPKQQFRLCRMENKHHRLSERVWRRRRINHEVEVLRYAASFLDRDDLIAFCERNDPNGCWTDEDREAEGFDPCTRDELVEIVLEWAEDLEK